MNLCELQGNTLNNQLVVKVKRETYVSKRTIVYLYILKTRTMTLYGQQGPRGGLLHKTVST